MKKLKWVTFRKQLFPYVHRAQTFPSAVDFVNSQRKQRKVRNTHHIPFSSLLKSKLLRATKWGTTF